MVIVHSYVNVYQRVNDLYLGDTPRAYVTLGVHPILRTVLVGVNDCNGIGGYEISCFGMLRYGWFQPKQTNKQTINHRYTIYGIERGNKRRGIFPWDTIWLFNSSPWKTTMLLIGKPSISMGHLYHGELLVITRG